MEELKKRLQELLEKGAISKEAFDEVMKGLEEEKKEPEVKEEVKAKEEKEPVLAPLPPKEEVKEEVVEEKPLPPVPPVEEKVEKEIEEHKEEEHKPDDEKIKSLEETLHALASRVEQLETAIKELGVEEEHKEEDKEEIGKKREEELGEDKEDFTDILDMPGMGGRHF